MNGPHLYVALALAVTLATAAGAEGHADPGSIPHYRLKARFEPASRRVEAEVCIEGVPGARFFLHKGMEIRRLTAEGRSVPFHWDRAAGPYRYAPESAVVVVDGPVPRTLCTRYAGAYPEPINDVNRLAPDLVELASYSAWYPVYEGLASFSFDLEADLPAGFVLVTNGGLESRKERAGRVVTRWKDVRPGSDVVLLASPGLRRMDGARGDARVELYFKRLPVDAVRSLRDRLVEGMARLTGLYGPPGAAGILRFVYSPRSGWGYSRVPLFVVPEGYAQEQLQAELGEARTVHGSCHEMAHFWWNLASSDSPDDWINEGLAELSAFRISRELFGEAFAERLTTEYREHAAQSPEDVAIAETEGSSPARYVNRYEKTTLLFIEAGRRFGQDRLDAALRALHTRHKGTWDLTTARFLAEIERQMGTPTRDFFERVLFARRWSEDPLGASTGPAPHPPERARP